MRIDNDTTRKCVRMDEEEQYTLIRKAVFTPTFLKWMEKAFKDIDSEQLENETTDLYNELNNTLEGKPLIPAIVALSEATCTIYKNIVRDKKMI
jgi:hypothetical protein